MESSSSAAEPRTKKARKSLITSRDRPLADLGDVGRGDTDERADLRNGTEGVPEGETAHPQRWCARCDHTLPTAALLHQHLLQEHGELAPFTCHLCGWGTFTRRSLSRHIWDWCLDRGRRIYPCPTCGMVFVTSSPLMSHLKKAHSQDTLTYPCSECSKSFPSKVLLENHVCLVHDNRWPYPCESCYFRFRNLSDVEKHVAEQHGSKEAKATCATCRVSFPDDGAFREHNKKYHAPVYPDNWYYSCHLCMYVVASPAVLKAHLQSVHDLVPPPTTALLRVANPPPRSPTCPVCDRQFALQDDLRVHCKHAHGINPTDVPLHVPSYVVDVPLRRVDCTLCNARLRTTFRVVDHYTTNHKDEISVRYDPVSGAKIRATFEVTPRIVDDTFLEVSGSNVRVVPVKKFKKGSSR